MQSPTLTPRRSDRATTGAEVAGISRVLGRDLLPWQRYVADVAGELDPTTGRYCYGTVVLAVPRRAGKSWLLLAMMLARAITLAGQRVWYTAQDRSNPMKLWRQEWSPAITRSPLNAIVRQRASQGSEEFGIDRRGSFISLFSPVPNSLHSAAGDLIVFDEAWAHSRERGAELMTAAGPITATRPNPQIWIVSAAGDVDSTWWADWLETLRAAVAADLGHGVAGFEWSADHPGAEPDNPERWPDYHPALITADRPGTIRPEFLAEQHAADPATFHRAYMNITDRAGVTSTPVPVDLWDTLAGSLDRTGPIVLGVDCAADQASTSIVAAGNDQPCVELIDHRPGTGWVPARLAELVDRYDVTTIVFDPGSPAGALAPIIRRVAASPTELALRDVTAAAAGLVEAIRTGQIRHVPHPTLDHAAANARRRLVGDGSWTFDRIRSSGDVSPLIAAMFARWAHPAVTGAAPAIG